MCVSIFVNTDDIHVTNRVNECNSGSGDLVLRTTLTTNHKHRNDNKNDSKRKNDGRGVERSVHDLNFEQIADLGLCIIL